VFTGCYRTYLSMTNTVSDALALHTELTLQKPDSELKKIIARFHLTNTQPRLLKSEGDEMCPMKL
jgi:hypothetical protein